MNKQSKWNWQRKTTKMAREKSLWTTWWSKAQRGMGVKERCNAPIQEVRITLPRCTQIRFRFSAFYDVSSITIKNAFFQVPNDHTKYALSFHGNEDGVILSQTSIVSDPIACNFYAYKEIILTYEICSVEGCTSGVSLLPFDEVTSLSNIVYAFHGVDVVSDELKGCICVFGDSIVEMGMYTNVLRKALLSFGYVLINAGISGNRLLRQLDDVLYPQACGQIQRLRNIPLDKQCFGLAGRTRFYRDVFSVHQNVHHVLIAIGINDLYQPGSFCANRSEFPKLMDMKEGYRALIASLKKQVTYTICTITPFLSDISNDFRKEELRLQINTWIQEFCKDTSCVCFDDALMDASHALRSMYHDGDALHPNQKGGNVMAKLVEKELWRVLQ